MALLTTPKVAMRGGPPPVDTNVTAVAPVNPQPVITTACPVVPVDGFTPSTVSWQGGAVVVVVVAAVGGGLVVGVPAAVVGVVAGACAVVVVADGPFPQAPLAAAQCVVVVVPVDPAHDAAPAGQCPPEGEVVVELVRAEPHVVVPAGQVVEVDDVDDALVVVVGCAVRCTVVDDAPGWVVDVAPGAVADGCPAPPVRASTKAIAPATTTAPAPSHHPMRPGGGGGAGGSGVDPGGGAPGGGAPGGSASARGTPTIVPTGTVGSSGPDAN